MQPTVQERQDCGTGFFHLVHAGKETSLILGHRSARLSTCDRLYVGSLGTSWAGGLMHASKSNWGRVSREIHYIYCNILENDSCAAGMK